MRLGEMKQIMIGGRVVDVTQGGNRIFAAGGLRYCAVSGRGLNFHGEPFGPQLAFPVPDECAGCMAVECFCEPPDDKLTMDHNWVYV